MTKRGISAFQFPGLSRQGVSLTEWYNRGEEEPSTLGAASGNSIREVLDRQPHLGAWLVDGD